MKGIDICTSQAATAICLSMEQHSSSSPSPSTLLLSAAAAAGGSGGRFIDRHNPAIRDTKRIPKSLPPCTSSHPPITPKPRKIHPKKTKKNPNFDENENQPKVNDGGAAIVRRSWSCTKPGDFLSPPGSTRYLLSEKVVLSDSEPAKVSVEENLKSKDATTEVPSSSDQVVVLRVSLHCRGCEKKLRKHLSRMEGVTSFTIDFMAKKVTVTGNVTPSGVLSSISKVKNAQLWPPTISSSFTPSLNISNSEIKN